MAKIFFVLFYSTIKIDFDKAVVQRLETQKCTLYTITLLGYFDVR